mgnify:FL=1
MRGRDGDLLMMDPNMRSVSLLDPGKGGHVLKLDETFFGLSELTKKSMIANGLWFPSEEDISQNSNYKKEVTSGQMCMEDGSKFQGKMVGGTPHGPGYLLTPQRDLLVANFFYGKASGGGAVYYSNGDYFVGTIEDNKPVKGTISYVNGDVYCGTILGSKPDGEGVYRFDDGRLYRGEFKDGLRNGKGRFEWVDGCVFDGVWENGKATEEGEFTDPDGVTHHGKFRGFSTVA